MLPPHYPYTYALVRKHVVEKNPDIIREISTYFSDNYTNFD